MFAQKLLNSTGDKECVCACMVRIAGAGGEGAAYFTEYREDKIPTNPREQEWVYSVSNSKVNKTNGRTKLRNYREQSWWMKKTSSGLGCMFMSERTHRRIRCCEQRHSRGETQSHRGVM